MTKILTVVSGIFLILSCNRANAEMPIKHPDGIVGRANGWFGGSYSPTFTVPYDVVNDNFRIGIGLNYPLTSRLTIESDFSIVKGDTLFYDYRINIKFYSKTPVGENINANPDGPVGMPVFKLIYNGNMPDIEIGRHDFSAGLIGILPVSRYLTFGAGGKYYHRDDEYQVDKLFGIISLYPREYLPGRVYDNPDGLEGFPSFKLCGGGSINGIVGQLDIIVPLNPGLTLVLTTKGERAAEPYMRRATIGAKIKIYPGN